MVNYYSKNLDKTREFGKVEWYKPGHRVKGFQVFSIPDSSPLKLGGIEENDIVLSISGKKINSHAAIGIAFMKLAFKSSFDIEILRSDHKISIRYDFAP